MTHIINQFFSSLYLHTLLFNNFFLYSYSMRLLVKINSHGQKSVSTLKIGLLLTRVDITRNLYSAQLFFNATTDFLLIICRPTQRLV